MSYVRLTPCMSPHVSVSRHILATPRQLLHTRHPPARTDVHAPQDIPNPSWPNTETPPHPTTTNHVMWMHILILCFLCHVEEQRTKTTVPERGQLRSSSLPRQTRHPTRTPPRPLHKEKGGCATPQALGLRRKGGRTLPTLLNMPTRVCKERSNLVSVPSVLHNTHTQTHPFYTTHNIQHTTHNTYFSLLF